MSSRYVKLRAGNKQRDEPSVQRIIFDCSIQELRKDLKREKCYVKRTGLNIFPV